MRGLTAVVLLTPVAGYVMESRYVDTCESDTRWGHASTFLPDPPSLLIQGGRVDPPNSYSYHSAPTSPDTILLPLTEAFSASDPPFALLAPITPGPAQAWHCLATLGREGSRWQVLSFGGDVGWNQANSNAADSVWLIDIDPAAGWVNYTHQPSRWAGQPPRRIYHSCASSMGGGTVFITGGNAIDGSRLYGQVFAFSPATNTFAQLPSLPNPISHHSSVLLGNGTLLVFGGVYPGENQLVPADMVLALDTTEEGASWQILAVSGASMPSPRLGATASLLSNGMVLVVGGTDVSLAQADNDDWLLDVETLQWSRSASTSSGMFDHSASSVGDKVIVVGGYGSGAPAPPRVQVIEAAGAVAPTFSWGSQTATSPAPASGIPAAATGTGLPKTGDGHGGATDPGNGIVIATPSATGYIPTPTASNSAASKARHRRTIIIASVLVSVALLVIFIILLWLCLRKDKEKPQTSKEKGEGTARLMDDEADAGIANPPPPQRKTATLAALGHGISRAASVLRKVSNGDNDGYRSLGADALPKRRSTKRQFGRGIRLVHNADSLPPVPSGVRDATLRRGMLDNEDFEWATPPPVPAKPSSGASNARVSKNWTIASSEAIPTPATEYHDLGLPVAAWPPLRKHPRGPIPPASTYHHNDTDTESIATRSDVPARASSQAEPEDTSFTTIPDLAVFPSHSARRGARESFQSTGMASVTPSLQEVDNAVIANAQQARSSVARSYGSPDKYQDAMVSSPEGTRDFRPLPSPLDPPRSASASLFHRLSNNVLGLRNRTPTPPLPLPIRDPAPQPTDWPLQSSCSHGSVSSSDSLGRPRIDFEGEPSVVSLPSVHTMRDMLVVQREVSATSATAIVESPSRLEVVETEEPSSASSYVASFVTAQESGHQSGRPSLDDEDHPETGPLLSVFSEGLGPSTDVTPTKPSLQKPLPRPPTNPSDALDPFSIDFGPTLAAAEGLASPVVKLAASPKSAAKSFPPAVATPTDSPSCPSPASPTPRSKRPAPPELTPRAASTPVKEALPVLKRVKIATPVASPSPSPARNTPRRAVRDIAASINKRNASAHPEGGLEVKYETVRRPSLVVANPDKKR